MILCVPVQTYDKNFHVCNFTSLVDFSKTMESQLTSLEDDEDLLIRTNTPGGPKYPNKQNKHNSSYGTSLVPCQVRSTQQQSTPGMHRQPSSQERPPSSIFKADPLILSSGYLRDIIKIENIKTDIIPSSIYQLCKDYYIKKYNNMHLDSSNILLKKLIVNRIDDQSYIT